jgi:type III secretory pathway component EscV
MRLQAAMAKDEKLWKQIQLLQATEEFEAALRRYASLMDEINGNEDGTTLKLIVKVLKEDVGLPIHNIPSEFHTEELQNALVQLQEAIQQRFEIHEDEIILLEKQVDAFKKVIKKQNKQNYPKVKTIGRPIPGHQHQPAWNRTRSNPKLR